MIEHLFHWDEGPRTMLSFRENARSSSAVISGITCSLTLSSPIAGLDFHFFKARHYAEHRDWEAGEQGRDRCRLPELFHRYILAPPIQTH
jgi:hypothetical protein